MLRRARETLRDEMEFEKRVSGGRRESCFYQMRNLRKLIIGEIAPGALHINAESLLRESLKKYLKGFNQKARGKNSGKYKNVKWVRWWPVVKAKIPTSAKVGTKQKYPSRGTFKIRSGESCHHYRSSVNFLTRLKSLV